MKYWSDILYSSDTGENMEFNEKVHQLFTDFENASDSGQKIKL
jgi:hypothetical protein